LFESVTRDPGNAGLERATRIFYVLAVLGVFGFGIRVLALLRGGPDGMTLIGAIIALVSTVLAFFTARGMEAQRPWSRNLAYVQGALSLLNVPIGTIIGIAVLIYVSRADRAGLFQPS